MFPGWMTMIEYIEVTRVAPLDDHRIRLEFSNGRTGVRDLTDVLTEGGEMVEPLRESAFFKKVFVSCGVPTWPNGFDLDAINLYMELDQAGQLTPARELGGASDPRSPLREYE
jgi:Protein of unknown function (DUF2442)